MHSSMRTRSEDTYAADVPRSFIYMLLHVCPQSVYALRTHMQQMLLAVLSICCYICVLRACPHTAMHVSSYYYIRAGKAEQMLLAVLVNLCCHKSLYPPAALAGQGGLSYYYNAIYMYIYLHTSFSQLVLPQDALSSCCCSMSRRSRRSLTILCYYIYIYVLILVLVNLCRCKTLVFSYCCRRSRRLTKTT
jgi:hypothetical protein